MLIFEPFYILQIIALVMYLVWLFLILEEWSEIVLAVLTSVPLSHINIKIIFQKSFFLIVFNTFLLGTLH